MRRTYKIALFALLFIGLPVLLFFAAQSGHFSVLEPSGAIGMDERGLIVQAVLLMLIVIVPVFGLLFFFAWRYRAGNESARYAPDWEHSRMDELVWWAIPAEIILVLAAITWTSTHALDPHKPLDSARGEPLVVEVVALPWKWLFIYPAEGVASMNLAELPVGRPVEFRLTADAPMNAFWVPELGGMMMAMPGMVNTLHLVADRAGDFSGVSSNYSGDGFADMRFIARAVPQSQFAAWAASAKQNGRILTDNAYEALAAPSVATTTEYWSAVEPNLFSAIIGKYMSMPAENMGANH